MSTRKQKKVSFAREKTHPMKLDPERPIFCSVKRKSQPVLVDLWDKLKCPHSKNSWEGQKGLTLVTFRVEFVETWADRALCLFFAAISSSDFLPPDAKWSEGRILVGSVSIFVQYFTLTFDMISTRSVFDSRIIIIQLSCCNSWLYQAGVCKLLRCFLNKL